jgi:hypothetical protein
MKKTSVWLVSATVLVLGAVPNVQAGECSNASLKGAYGFLDSHTAVPARDAFHRPRSLAF